MKNKIAIFAVVALLFAPAVSNARWGTEFTGASWTMDGKEVTTLMHTYQAVAAFSSWSMAGKVTEGKLGGSASLFIEGNSRVRLGGSIGYGAMPDVMLKIRVTSGPSPIINLDMINKTTYIPVDLYLKGVSKSGKFSLFGGGGADYVIAKSDYDEWSGSTVKGSFSQKKLVPHVQAGGELFLAKWISLNVSAKYLFSAVLDNLTGGVSGSGYSAGKRRLTMQKWSLGEVTNYPLTSSPLAANERPFKYDLSGLRANVGLKIYFN